jgi:GABA(A) receptor-associated protein
MHFNSEFKKKYSAEERKLESAKMLSKFPDKIPVIVEKLPNCTLPGIDKKVSCSPGYYGSAIYGNYS